MPLQNRVNPFGGLDAVQARGAWLGNRGILHNDDKQIVSLWRSKAWITCRLRFKSVHRVVFSPHTWSELFFLDEATAFAAGHRPCAYCRRKRYSEFKQAWCSANASLIALPHPPVTEIDLQLHAQRVTRGGTKVTHRERFGSLPTGTFVVRERTPCLIWQGQLFPWSHKGYGHPVPTPAPNSSATVLTPASIVAMFRKGFQPAVHPSAVRWIAGSAPGRA